MYKIDAEELLEVLVYKRLDEIISRGDLKYKQVYKYSEAQTELTDVGSQLFCYWYDHYQKLFDEHTYPNADDEKDLDSYTPFQNKRIGKYIEQNKIQMIDPPSGWRYGFPKQIPANITNVVEWLLENGYPQSEVDKFKNEKGEVENFFTRCWYIDKDEQG
jgi:hypothetical protein